MDLTKATKQVGQPNIYVSFRIHKIYLDQPKKKNIYLDSRTLVKLQNINQNIQNIFGFKDPRQLQNINQNIQNIFRFTDPCQVAKKSTKIDKIYLDSLTFVKLQNINQNIQNIFGFTDPSQVAKYQPKYTKYIWIQGP